MNLLSMTTPKGAVMEKLRAHLLKNGVLKRANHVWEWMRKVLEGTGDVESVLRSVRKRWIC